MERTRCALAVSRVSFLGLRGFTGVHAWQLTAVPANPIHATFDFRTAMPSNATM